MSVWHGNNTKADRRRTHNRFLLHKASRFPQVASAARQFSQIVLSWAFRCAAGWQVKFKYFDYDTKQQRAFRKKGGWYIVSPFALVYCDDNYYLLGYDAEKGKIMNYRVDRMAYVSAQEGKIREGKDVFAALDLAQYQRYTFSMYSGEVQRVTMRFRNNMMNAVIDKFGKLGYVKEVDKDHFEVTVSVAVSPQFFGWVFGLGNYVTIVGPEDVKEKMKKMLDSVRKRYE